MITAHVGSLRTQRRTIALSLILALGVSVTEAMAGPLRDGSVHHESAAEAVSHQAVLGQAHDHHGSMDAATPTKLGTASQSAAISPAGEKDHEHPGGDDHCTHVHGVALVPTVSLVFTAIQVDARMIHAVRHEDPSTTSVRHPPKA